jgi:murein DD-endopeptidase MepM/ murein hydrolase activator NlpD
VAASALALVAVATTSIVRRHRAQPPRAISFGWPDAHGPLEPPPPPILVGPPWPPTDDQWRSLFDGAAWTHPLPGPDRRPASADARIFGPEPRDRPALCRSEGRCGVDLGGELWGEHVYAALDGVVERVHDDEQRGGLSVRLVHFGGAVFTQYLHLAATPRGITRGAHVRAGDVIGLLGDTGEGGAPRHLAFALSVRPASELSEVYWDPTPWIARAALRRPPHGTVAGYTPADL